jgi:hypothetical protein
MQFRTVACLLLLAIATVSAVELSAPELSSEVQHTLADYNTLRALEAKVAAGQIHPSPALVAAIAHAQRMYDELQSTIQNADKQAPAAGTAAAVANVAEAHVEQVSTAAHQNSQHVWENAQHVKENAVHVQQNSAYVHENSQRIVNAAHQRMEIVQAVGHNSVNADQSRAALVQSINLIKANAEAINQNKAQMQKLQRALSQTRSKNAMAKAAMDFELKKAALAIKARAADAVAKRAAESKAMRMQQQNQLIAQQRARAIVADRLAAESARRAKMMMRLHTLKKRIATKRAAARRFAAHMRMLKDAQHKALDEIKGQQLQAAVEGIEMGRKIAAATYDVQLDSEKDQIRTALKRTVENARLDQIRAIHELQMHAQLKEAELEDETARSAQRILAAYNRQRIAAEKPRTVQFVEASAEAEAEAEAEDEVDEE